jgi:hypothetical protein
MLHLLHQLRSHERLHRRAEPLFEELNPGTAHSNRVCEFAQWSAFSQAFEYCSGQFIERFDKRLPVQVACAGEGRILCLAGQPSPRMSGSPLTSS